jgi:Flp pilus assembly protein TadD
MESTKRNQTLQVLSRVAAAALLAASVTACVDKGASNRVGSLADLPNKDDSMLRLGDASRGGGDCAAALHFYQIVLEKADSADDKLKAELGLGACYAALGKFPEAEQAFKEAQKIAPNDPAPMLGLGRFYLSKKDPGQAIAALDAAIQKGATAPTPWNDKGVAYDQLRRHKEAQAAYREGLTKYPNDHALRSNLGLSLAMSGDFPEAESLLRVSAQEPDASPRDRQNFALLLGMEGNSEAARTFASSDLDGAGVENNLRFYQYARALVTGVPQQPGPVAPISRRGLSSDHKLGETATRSSATMAGRPELDPVRSAAATQIGVKANFADLDRVPTSSTSAINLVANAGSGNETGMPTSLISAPVTATQSLGDTAFVGPVASSEGEQP